LDSTKLAIYIYKMQARFERRMNGPEPCKPQSVINHVRAFGSRTLNLLSGARKHPAVPGFVSLPLGVFIVVEVLFEIEA
jgi:hypothetical protein